MQSMGAATCLQLGCPARYMQISYNFSFMPHFGILQKSMSVGPAATTFTDVIKQIVESVQ